MQKTADWKTAGYATPSSSSPMWWKALFISPVLPMCLGSSANLLDSAVVECEQPKLEIFAFISSSVG